MRELAELDFDTFVPGRYQVGDRKQFQRGADYIEAIQESTQQAFIEMVPVWILPAITEYVKAKLGDRFGDLDGFEQHVGLSAFRIAHHYLMGGLEPWRIRPRRGYCWLTRWVSGLALNVMKVAFDVGILPNRPVTHVGDLAADAESQGFQGIWIADSQSIFRDAYSALTICALRTRKILLGHRRYQPPDSPPGSNRLQHRNLRRTVRRPRPARHRNWRVGGSDGRTKSLHAG